jgi:hypothetical protein
MVMVYDNSPLQMGYYVDIFFSMAQQPFVGQGLLFIEAS